VTCRAGEGLYLGSRARVFRTTRGLFACSENEKARPVTIGGRRARLLRATETASAFAYVVREGSRETVGYMDVRSSALRARVRRATDYGGVPEILGLATRTDGGVAFAAEAGVFLMPPAGRSLGAPVQLATGSVAPHTLSLTKTAVEWRAVGEPRSESLPGT
jgi:hypothetical protein